MISHYATAIILIVSLSLIPTAFGQTLAVTSVTPEINGMSAPVDGSIDVVFNKTVNQATVTSSSVRAFGKWSGPASGTISFPANDTFRFTPTSPFFYGEQVTVSLSTAITDNSGSPMATGYQWMFWTAVTGGSLNFIFEDQIDIREQGEGSILSYGAYAGDFNNDGWSDLLVPNETPDDFRVFLNNTAGRYTDFTIYDMPESNSPSTNEGADFNNDGEIDIAIGSGSGKNVSLFMGTGSGTFGPESAYEAGDQGSWIRGLCVVDLEGDGWDDIVATTRDGNKVSLLYNDGDGSFGSPVQIEANGETETTCAPADINRDGILDIFVGSFVSQTISILLGDGVGGFTFSDSISVEGFPWMSVAGDLNGDHIPDVITSGFTGRNISIAFANEDGTFESTVSHIAGDAVLAVDLGDLDADGDLDVVTSNLSSADWTIFENDGAGTLTIFGRIDASSSGSCAILHDRDNDGDLDLTGVDETDDVILLYENPNDNAVEGLTLEAHVDDNIVDLFWSTTSEEGNLGFDVQLQNQPSNLAHPELWSTVGFVSGAGDSRSPNYYSFSHDAPSVAVTSYRLRQVNVDGSFMYSNMVEIKTAPPVFTIHNPYPNPFADNATIGISAQSTVDVTINVVDVSGREVSPEHNITVPSGIRVDFVVSGSQLAPGVYFARIAALDKQYTIPLVITE